MATDLTTPRTPDTAPPSEADQTTEVTFPVTGMTCASCVRRIEKRLGRHRQRAGRAAAPGEGREGPRAPGAGEGRGDGRRRHQRRAGLIGILLWLGAFKFTPTEAEAIRPLLEPSPLMRWLYLFTGVQGASNLIGVAEIAVAVLLAARPVAPRLAVIGSTGGIVTFLVTSAS